MAAFTLNMGGRRIKQSEATAARATLMNIVNTHEAQVVTVSKNGGAFGATAGSTNTQVTGTTYKLAIHADDLDTIGDVAFLSTGATDTLLIYNLQVVEDDPHEVADAVAAKILATPAQLLVTDASGRVDLGTDSLDADALKTDAVTEIVSAVLLSLIRYLRPPIMRIKQGTSTVVPCTVHTHEAKTVTVSKAGGAFGATAGSVAAQIAGNDYKLTLHATDLDTLGYVKFLLTGATSVEVVEVLVVEDDPTQESDATVAKALIADLAGYEATGDTGTRLADMIAAIRAEVAGAMALSGTTLTVYEVDGVTAMGSHTLDSATMPRTRTGLA